MIQKLTDSGFWRDKRVLITGHTGFKGSWLSLWLQSMAVTLRGIALDPPTQPSLFEAARVADGMEHFIADIRDFDSVKMHIDNFKPDIIIHMAAQPLVRRSYQQPIETYATNVMGTLHILEAGRNCDSVKAIVNITTDKCYKNRELVWSYREDEPMGGNDPYSSSKACSELVSSAYRKSYLENSGIALATARAGNVIGGGDWALDRLVPDIFRGLQGKVPIQIRNPHAVRPWQHVLEPLSGYLLLAEKLYKHGQIYAEGWNFGPLENDARPVKFIVEYLCNNWGNHSKWTVQLGDHPHESSFLKLDITKAQDLLSWRPRWTLESALSRTIDWQKALLDCQDMHKFCNNQISQYQYNL